MTAAPKNRASGRRAKTEYASSWSTDGPLTLEVERSDGSAQLMWLKFSRKGFDGRVYLRIESAKEVYEQLGKLIADAEAARARM